MYYIYIYVYVHLYVYCTCTYIYIYMYIRERRLALPPHGPGPVFQLKDFQTTGAGTWKHLESTLNIMFLIVLLHSNIYRSFLGKALGWSGNCSLLCLSYFTSYPSLRIRGARPGQHGKHRIRELFFWAGFDWQGGRHLSCRINTKTVVMDSVQSRKLPGSLPLDTHESECE